jgi:hypothetical protein
MQSLKNFFSIDSIIQKSVLLARRFPVSVLLLVILATWMFIDISNIWGKFSDIIDENFLPSYRLYIFLTVGIVISITVTLWLEDVVGYIRRYLITAGIMLLWGAYCTFLLPGSDYDIENATFTLEYIINRALEICAIFTISYLAMFFICFLKREKDRDFWNFSTRIYFQQTSALVFGCIVYIGLAGAFLAVYALFGIALGGHIMYAYIAIFCFALFAPLYFLANVPDQTAKYDDVVRPNKTFKVFGLYVLTPLAVIYAVILYCYLFTIIVSWELPKGLVCWLVSALACSGLSIITLLYPVRILEKNKFANFLSRWLGVIILPLIVLMSIGIFRRISDYGITILRLYALLINFWFYGIYAHIFITKAMRIKWIHISIAAVILLTFIGPLNVPGVTKYMLTAEVAKYLDGQKIPRGKRHSKHSDIRAAIEKMTLADDETKEKVISKIVYLRDIYGIESVERFFIDIIEADDGPDIEETPAKPEKPNPEKYFEYGSANKLVNDAHQANGFNNFVHIDYSATYRSHNKYIDCRERNGQLIINITNRDGIKQEISFPIRETVIDLVEKHDEKARHGLQGDGCTLFINRITGKYNTATGSISVLNLNGYLFYNK